MKYNSEELIKIIADGHRKDTSVIDHVETTITGMRGILKAFMLNTNSPEMNKVIEEISNDIYSRFQEFKVNERMNVKTRVFNVLQEEIQFDNGFKLKSDHIQDCCEQHWLDFSNVKDDFDGLIFDLSSDNFFTRIPEFGISLNPINGFPVRIPGYGSNNGYYSDNLTLILYDQTGEVLKTYDISDCQVVTD